VTIRLGTRGSRLALTQARWVAERLDAEVEIVRVRTSGDEERREPPGEPSAEVSDKARFVKELEEALLAETIDLAVHSAKDVPGELPEGLAIVGVPVRGDPHDALCGARSLAELRDGAVVGTASLRRQAELLALRPDLRIKELRGNVDTRLRRLDEGGYDAIVLAMAGLERLGVAARGSRLPELVPASGQGCLALEAREGDEPVASAAAAVTDIGALTRLTAERALVTALGATCHTPVGAHAELGPDGSASLRMTAFVGLPDGSHWIRDELEGDPAEPAKLGVDVADRLRSAGAAELLAEAELVSQSTRPG
jgi:hydroxymethylbilane synthase